MLPNVCYFLTWLYYQTKNKIWSSCMFFFTPLKSCVNSHLMGIKLVMTQITVWLIKGDYLKLDFFFFYLDPVLTQGQNLTKGGKKEKSHQWTLHVTLFYQFIPISCQKSKTGKQSREGRTQSTVMFTKDSLSTSLTKKLETILMIYCWLYAVVLLLAGHILESSVYF